MFEGCVSLSHDLDIPINTTNCINAFKDCKLMTHIHGNWTKQYASGITSSGCYSGCIDVTHIDGENVITYEGKEALDEIPEAWGGYGFTLEDTCVFKVEIPSDNYELILNGAPVTGRIENTGLLTAWGDKASNTSNYHIYEKSGVYVIKTKFNGSNTWNSSNTLRATLVEILQTRTKNCKMALRDCSKLRYWNLDNCVVAASQMVYNGASYGLTISAKNVKFNTYIPWRPIATWQHEFTQEVIESWDLSKVTSLNDLFYGCSNEVIDLTNVTFNSNITAMPNTFQDCKKLKRIIGLDKLITSKVTNLSSTFANCSSLTSVDLSSCTMNVTRYNSTFSGCTSLVSVKFPSDVAQPTDVTGMFSRTSSLMRIENCPIITMGTSGMTYMYWAYSDGNTNPIGQVITFSTKGALGNWDIYYTKNFFKRVASETITNIANAAYDYTTEGKTITYNTNGSLAYFTDAQISIFTNKGWTLT
jgi:hypothetical protein